MVRLPIAAALLASALLAACSGTPAGTPPAPAAACPASPASPASPAAGSVSSKVRHVPNEGDPCAGTHGVAPRLAAP